MHQAGLGHSHSTAGKEMSVQGSSLGRLTASALRPATTPPAPSHLGAGGSPTAAPGASWWAQDTQRRTQRTGSASGEHASFDFLQMRDPSEEGRGGAVWVTPGTQPRDPPLPFNLTTSLLPEPPPP